jgi:hypothetical protein
MPIEARVILPVEQQDHSTGEKSKQDGWIDNRIGGEVLVSRPALDYFRGSDLNGVFLRNTSTTPSNAASNTRSWSTLQ